MFEGWEGAKREIVVALASSGSLAEWAHTHTFTLKILNNLFSSSIDHACT
jgi:hypothetical protein